jgi:hypothetical protein
VGAYGEHDRSPAVTTSVNELSRSPGEHFLAHARTAAWPKRTWSHVNIPSLITQRQLATTH